jgi:hypothetical protein
VSLGMLVKRVRDLEARSVATDAACPSPATTQIVVVGSVPQDNGRRCPQCRGRHVLMVRRRVVTTPEEVRALQTVAFVNL